MSRIYETLEEAEKGRERNNEAWRVTGNFAMPVDPEPEAYGTEPKISKDQQALVTEYQTLRGTLQSMARGRRSQGIVVCSSVQREGTSKVAAELAIVCALHNGSRILLVDAHLRSPDVHRRFRINQSPGLMNVLAEDRPLPEKEIIESPIPGLFLLPAGDAGLDPIAAFEAEGFKAMLRHLGQAYDLVILDSGPVHTCPETLALAEQAGGVVLVVRAERTRIDVVKAARDRLLGRNAQICGVVLNNRKYYIPEFIYRQL
jgi:capsular exopolysaccharide synthesis family protein